MRVDVTSEIAIHRRHELVADYVFDPSNLPLWRSDVVAARCDDRPLRAGSQIRIRSAVRLGRLGSVGRTERVERVLAVDPRQRLDVRTTWGMVPVEMRTTVVPELRHSALMTIHLVADLQSAALAVSPILGRTLRRLTAADLTRLKTILELEQA